MRTPPSLPTPSRAAVRRPQTATVDEREVGIHAYATASTRDEIGGELKVLPEDFNVTELQQDGQPVELGEGADGEQADKEETEWNDWDEDLLVRFVLRKERQDTLGAVAEMAQELQVPERAFSYAGLKDYHAITTQEVVVQGVHPSRLRKLQLAKLTIGRVRIAKRKLRLGECGGNRFRIRLRRVRQRGAAVDAAFGGLRDTGFINYFGLQRFGSNVARNDEVGRALLLGNYVEAVDVVLTRTPDGQRVCGAEADARAAWARSGDASMALRLMPKQRIMERALLRRLSEDRDREKQQQSSAASTRCWSHEQRCRRAVLSLPLAQRRLLAHAYFSKSWNLMASERLRRHGCRPAMRGELVIPPPGWRPAAGDEAEESDERGEGWSEEWEGDAEDQEEWEEEEERQTGQGEAWSGESWGGEAWSGESWGGEAWGGEGEGEGDGEVWATPLDAEHAACDDAAAAAEAELASSVSSSPSRDQQTELAEPAAEEEGPYMCGRHRRSRVHVVTAAEAASGTFGAERIVLPLPGEAIIYPRDEIGSLYRQLLAHEGIEPTWPCLEVSASRPSADESNWLALQGDYRALLLRPQNMEWRYHAPTAAEGGGGDIHAPPPATAAEGGGGDITAATSDAAPMPDDAHRAEEAGSAGGAAAEASDEARGDVTMQFDLPPGAYATMALREVMRVTPAASLGHIRFNVDEDEDEE